jgi:hypothetical protein
MKKIQHFYHIYCKGDNWKDIVREHFYLLYETNLYHYIDTIYVGLCGDQINQAKKFLRSLDLLSKIKIVNEQESGWEQVTLEYLELNKEQFKDDVIFYAHTKGSSKTNKSEIIKCYLWRKNMGYYNIQNWRDAVLSLKDFDTYGIHHLGYFNNIYFAGNYWWATGEAIGRTKKLLFKNRFQAEHWIGTIENIKYYDPCPYYPLIINFKGLSVWFRFYKLILSMPINQVFKKIKRELMRNSIAKRKNRKH